MGRCGGVVMSRVVSAFPPNLTLFRVSSRVEEIKMIIIAMLLLSNQLT